MNHIYMSACLLMSSMAVSGSTYANETPAMTKLDYFGETPPGLTPKLFDPKIVSPDGRFEGGTFSSDMKEFYFTRKNGKYKNRVFFVIRYENGRWGKESETDIRWPQFSLDGSMMYGGKWYRQKTDAGWSELKKQGDFLKEQGHGVSISAKGTYFFPFYKKEDKGKGNIGYSRVVNGKNQNPVKLGPQINKGEWIAHPYIAPDESYLMWDVVRDDGHGKSDIYISFKDKKGAWLPAVNMGPLINTNLNESSPRVTHDGKYLFFSRGDWHVQDDGSQNWVGKSYWVDAQIIEGLRPKL
ncbi:PD40 domain-containing protein [Pseudoalteromonas luteoviolacea]|uniref:Uncharacterized protein n=1 Tax=Pseudoalteromonas luteoviolacea DSM 6061 TaxID=1365250 RepID=A0A166YQT9_9GAMM|nr:PD40 domain-containing protein [Pseudoalteromonas luteoviolacea]KZN43277.1 hypothetical protein N475_09240 [Pseudoalteromonas luteoviolacea DSM 6061]MBE0385455.1 hypothetical protein [Pseudoalteromonas luteoviolacea DSM 6061]